MCLTCVCQFLTPLVEGWIWNFGHFSCLTHYSLGCSHYNGLCNTIRAEQRVFDSFFFSYHWFPSLLSSVYSLHKVKIQLSTISVLFHFRMSFTSSYRPLDNPGIFPVTQTVTSWSPLNRIRVSDLQNSSFLLSFVPSLNSTLIVYHLLTEVPITIARKFIG